MEHSGEKLEMGHAINKFPFATVARDTSCRVLAHADIARLSTIGLFNDIFSENLTMLAI